MVDAYTLLDPVMPYYVDDVTNRVLGQVDIYANPRLLLAYWEDPRAQEEWGHPTVYTLINRGPSIVAPWVIFLVKDIAYGEDQNGNALLTSIWFWGQSTGITSVGSRYQWWRTQLMNLRQNFTNRIHGVEGTTSIPVRLTGTGTLRSAATPQ